MEAEAALPLLQFWLTAESFHENLAGISRTSSPCGKQCSPEENLEDAISIYERWAHYWECSYISQKLSYNRGLANREVRFLVANSPCNEARSHSWPSQYKSV